ncbi:MAG: hypothetical protein LWX11_06790 [Firmicutes bacterium]|nr:hypothetical protein [Bacillota bacterium]
MWELLLVALGVMAYLAIGRSTQSTKQRIRELEAERAAHHQRSVELRARLNQPPPPANVIPFKANG